MKKLLFVTVLFTAIQLGIKQNVAAQKTSSGSGSYTDGVGLFLDLGNGGSFVGPHIKHYLTSTDAIQGMVLFGNGATIVGAEYSYNRNFVGAEGLKWNIGVGPQLAFGGGATAFLIRPSAGLEYKIAAAPIAIGFDWRPWIQVTNGSYFEAGRFGLAFKYTLN